MYPTVIDEWMPMISKQSTAACRTILGLETRRMLSGYSGCLFPGRHAPGIQISLLPIRGLHVGVARIFDQSYDGFDVELRATKQAPRTAVLNWGSLARHVSSVSALFSTRQHAAGTSVTTSLYIGVHVHGTHRGLRMLRLWNIESIRILSLIN